MTTIPVALFAYRRADLLQRTLDSLRLNGVTLIHAFSDGPRSAADAAAVDEVRAVLGAVDWAEVVVTARQENLGLGTSVVRGITEVLAMHEATMVSEDDIRIVPGCVKWVTAALKHYRDDSRVFSVSAWTHPRVVPPGHGTGPHFGKRFGGLFWGTWARAWHDMDKGSAATRLERFAARGGDPAVYGADVPLQAAVELERNIWAVRFIAEHLVKNGLTVCPPWNMAEHIGYDPRASNAAQDDYWYEPASRDAPPVPAEWPEPVEDPRMPALWQAAAKLEIRTKAAPSLVRRIVRRLLRLRRLLGG